MDKTPNEKSEYREMLAKNLGEESQTFRFQSTKDLVSTSSDKEREGDEDVKTPSVQPKSLGLQAGDLLNYKNLFYTLLFAIFGWMIVSLYNQNGEIGTLKANTTEIKGDISKLESEVNSIKGGYGGNDLVEKDLEYIKGRLNFIESKMRF